MFVSRDITCRRLEEVLSLECIGDYDRAIELLRPFWENFSELPDVSGLPEDLAAELILRCGSVLNYVGNARQIPFSHETAKNLLSSARRKFLSLENFEKVSECENHLALSYYHKGELDEAIVWIEQTMMRKIKRNCEIRFHSHIIKSMILLAEFNYKATIYYLDSLENSFESASNLMRGSFSTNKSLAYKNIGDFDNAIKYLFLARKFHIKSKHLPYLATVENNLAMIYKQRREFDLALKSANRAISLFSELKDSLRTAFTIDTKAQILIESGKPGSFAEAGSLADEAAEILRFGDSSAFLANVLLTKAKAALYQEKLSESLLIVADAINFSSASGDTAMLAIAKEFETEIISKFSRQTVPSKTIKLDLPSQVSHDQKLFPVKIVNDEFASIGLSKDTIAIGSYTETVRQGDLVAIADNGEFVKIGFYSKTSGLVCLSTTGKDSDLDVFDQTEVTIIGKIIGYCDKHPNERGRFYVNLLPNMKVK